MWFYILFKMWMVLMLPILARTIWCSFDSLDPARDEEILALLLLIVIHLWKGPLISVSARNCKVEEAFLCGLCYPVEAIILLANKHGLVVFI